MDVQKKQHVAHWIIFYFLAQVMVRNLLNMLAQCLLLSALSEPLLNLI